jgi:diaminopropionate ammonia-lyase
MNVQETARLRVHANPRAAPRAEPYGSERGRILSEAGFGAAEREIRGWPGYAETPLHHLPRLAARLRIAALAYKDESARFGLKSFKALGGAYAVYRLLAGMISTRTGIESVECRRLVDGEYGDVARAVTVTCATDGNHGRSVAWGAQLFGCHCVIYIHEGVSEARRAAIARYGAEVIRVRGNYDDSVRHAAAEAARHGWTVVSDTSYEAYRDIPTDVMHGYGVLAREIVRRTPDAPPTHVFVQAGVGGLAASLCAVFWIAWGERRPRLVVVEPTAADCHFQSARAGRPMRVAGSLDTVMAGLACGEVSPVAWEILDRGASAFVAIDDAFALDAMRVLAKPSPADPAIVAGETGASGLAALLAAHERDDVREVLGLDRSSRVLLIGSEGDTDPEIYARIVGTDPLEAKR